MPSVVISGPTIIFIFPGLSLMVPGGIKGPAPITTIGNTGICVSIASRNAPSLKGCRISLLRFCVPSAKSKIEIPSANAFLSLSKLFSGFRHLSGQRLQWRHGQSIRRQEFSTTLFLPMVEIHQGSIIATPANRGTKYDYLQKCMTALCGNFPSHEIRNG